MAVRPRKRHSATPMGRCRNSRTTLASPRASATAAVQFALGLTSRAFMVAEVMPRTPDTAQLTPELLAMTAREMLAKGNAVFEMLRGARAGGLTLLAVPGFEISGGLLPSQWQYALKWLDQNENEIVRTAASDSVIHVRYGATALAPWYGQSPMVAAGHGREGAGEHRQQARR